MTLEQPPRRGEEAKRVEVKITVNTRVSFHEVGPNEATIVEGLCRRSSGGWLRRHGRSDWLRQAGNGQALRQSWWSQPKRGWRSAGPHPRFCFCPRLVPAAQLKPVASGVRLPGPAHARGIAAKHDYEPVVSASRAGLKLAWDGSVLRLAAPTIFCPCLVPSSSLKPVSSGVGLPLARACPGIAAKRDYEPVSRSGEPSRTEARLGWFGAARLAAPTNSATASKRALMVRFAFLLWFFVRHINLLAVPSLASH